MNSTGLMMIVVGIFLISRSVMKDSHNQTLPERLLGITAASSSSGGGGSSSVAAGTISGAGVSTLPSSTALTGPAATSWAAAILKGLGAPRTRANISSMTAWFQREGGGGQNNPMNTTLPTPGATGSINAVGVKNYATPAAGISATVQTLQGGYSGIVSALHSGLGLGIGSGPAVASELSKWSGGGYSSL